MAHIDVARHVSADPSGVALLLSGPAARDVWPIGTVRFGPPQRSGIGFVVDVTAEEGEAALHGRVVVAAAGPEPRSTEVRRVAHTTGSDAVRLGAAVGEFLDGLVSVAQERSSAA